MFKIAVFNVWRQWRRFSFLLATILIGFALLLVMLFSIAGMQKIVSSKASRYFAGHLTFTAYGGDSLVSEADEQEILSTLKKSNQHIHLFTRRSIYYSANALLLYNGDSVIQRRIIGVDFSTELPLFQDMAMVSGSVNLMHNSDGILLSSLIAKKLNIHIGDQVTILLSTKTGQQNTVDFLVHGIFDESSFFAYSSYIDIKALNKAVGLPENAASDFGIILDDHRIVNNWYKKFSGMLKDNNKVLLPFASKEELANRISQGLDGLSYAFVPVSVHLDQIQDILDAISLVVWFVLVIFLIVVMIGVSNTYRMIVRERIQEIGTMRAMGLQRGKTLLLFLYEALIVACIGAVLGFTVALLILGVLTSIDWSNIPLMSLFTLSNRLVFFIDWNLLFIGVLVLLLSCVGGAFFPALRGARIRPVEAIHTI